MCVIIAEELFELVQLSGVPMDKELFKVVCFHASNSFVERDKLMHVCHYYIDFGAIKVEYRTNRHHADSQNN